MLATNASAEYFAVKNADGVMIYYYRHNSNDTKACVTSNTDTGKDYSGSVVIPKEVTYQNKTIKVVSITSNAFFKCSNLQSVTIPNSVTNIEKYAFKECSGLKSVNMSNSVTSIEYCTFLGCTNLTSITIPNSVTSIGDAAFHGCSSLTSITIPKSVTDIGFGILRDCSKLNSIKVEQGNKKYDSRNNCNAIIETKSNTLIAGCTNTVIPNNVTSIEKYAFQGMTSLKKSLFLTA